MPFVKAEHDHSPGIDSHTVRVHTQSRGARTIALWENRVPAHHRVQLEFLRDLGGRPLMAGWRAVERRALPGTPRLCMHAQRV
jgi:hypothetical protein